MPRPDRNPLIADYRWARGPGYITGSLVQNAPGGVLRQPRYVALRQIWGSTTLSHATPCVYTKVSISILTWMNEPHGGCMAECGNGSFGSAETGCWTPIFDARSRRKTLRWLRMLADGADYREQ